MFAYTAGLVTATRSTGKVQVSVHLHLLGINLGWHSLRVETVAYLRLAAPIVAGQLAAVGMSFVDTVMAGNLNATTLAAVAIGSAAWIGPLILIIGVLTSVTATVAQDYGAGRHERIGMTVRQAFWLSQMIAIVMFFVTRHLDLLMAWLDIEPEIVALAGGYLRALSWGIPPLCLFFVLRFFSEGLGITRPTMHFGILGLACNVVGNWVFMYGKFGFPAMGAIGCGVATALVFWAQCIGFVLYVSLGRRYRDAGVFRQFEWPDMKVLGELLRLGGPIGITLFIEASLFMAVSLLMGSLGPNIVAGHQVALNFASITFMVPLGIGLAATVRVGHAIGAGDYLSARFFGALALALTLCTQFISAFVMLVFPEWIVAIYTRDPVVTAIAVNLLFLAAIFQISDGVQACCAGALRGLKDTRVPMIITVVAYWGIGLPLSYYLGIRTGVGPAGLWIGFIAGLTVAALLMTFRFFRLSTALIGKDSLAERAGVT